LSEAKPIKFAQADDGLRKGSTHPTNWKTIARWAQGATLAPAKKQCVSSSAKADDPVNAIAEKILARPEYWVPRLRGA